MGTFQRRITLSIPEPYAENDTVRICFDGLRETIFEWVQTIPADAIEIDDMDSYLEFEVVIKVLESSMSHKDAIDFFCEVCLDLDKRLATIDTCDSIKLLSEGIWDITFIIYPCKVSERFEGYLLLTIR